ncbi:MAG TPA: DUF4274 domain-containing protein [Longimicrobiales bacterium]|nr:DUF4274 domain-containing protein [Longimicrobiales bacterium]
MIPRTYYDGNPEDRRYVHDYWSWLKDQPQDAWLLWARHANWDNADTIFAFMVDDPDCDLALVSWLFWFCGPAEHVRNPDFYRPGQLIRKIVENVERGLYRSSQLFYDRYEVAMAAHQYVKALRQTSGCAPFRLPRILCNCFDGRRACIPARYDDQTEQDLEELFHYLNGSLPRSEAEHWKQLVNAGNLSFKDDLTLPRVPEDPIDAYRDLDDAKYVEAIFGKEIEITALRQPRSSAGPWKRWWPFR